MRNVQVTGKSNVVDVPDALDLSGKIQGHNNIVHIKSVSAASQITLNLRGDYNQVIIEGGRFNETVLEINGHQNRCRIGGRGVFKRARLRVGNHVLAHDTVFEIGDDVTIEPGCAFLLFNSGSSVRIGQDCMLSTGITFRCGESPHLIFDMGTGEYLDTEGNIVIGDHCWIGERAYLTKRAAVADNSVVAACSVVSRRFTQVNCVLAGNPARVAKEGVSWARNRGKLAQSSREIESLDKFNGGFPYVTDKTC